MHSVNFSSQTLIKGISAVLQVYLLTNAVFFCQIETSFSQAIDERTRKFLKFQPTLFQNPFYPDCGIYPKQTKSELQNEVNEFLEWEAKRQKQKQGAALANARAFPVRFTVPVVVHLIEDVPTITDAQIHAAISSLNNAFSHTHDDPAGANFGFDGCPTCTPDGLDTEIEFCLVQRTPDGGVTNGITRISSEYVKFDKDTENEKLKTKTQWDPKYYLNIWVVSQIYSELGASHKGKTWWSRAALGGYGTFPDLNGVPSTASLDGVVVAGLSPTLWAHECGHYLRLYHTFQKDIDPATGEEEYCINNNCLINGDHVCDTPPDGTTDSAKGGCGAPDNSCSTDGLSYGPPGIPPMSQIINTPAYNLQNRVDMISNFMDYGNDACHTDFSPGQKERMLQCLSDVGRYRNAMITQAPSNNNVCIKPCGNVYVSFNQSKRYPLKGENIAFTSTATGGGVYEYDWYVEDLGIDGADNTGAPVAWVKGSAPSGLVAGAHNNPTLNYVFTENHKYRVICRAWDVTTPGCFASYQSIVNVTCGVDARFWPNKRFIAAKDYGPGDRSGLMDKTNPGSGGFLDTVTFFNRSIGATQYTWTVTHTPKTATSGTALPDHVKNLAGAPPTSDHEVYNDLIDLAHIFRQPGDYQITLRASDGAGCENISKPFNLLVDDPSVEGEALIFEAYCVDDDFINVTLQIRNNSYDTIPKGVPVSFYDGDPTAGPAKLLHTFALDKFVYGHEPNEWFYNIKFQAKPKVDNLVAVFNDPGATSFPLAFPESAKDILSNAGAGIWPALPCPACIRELNYDNNTWGEDDFQFKLNMNMNAVFPPLTVDFKIEYPTPLAATVCANSDYQFNAVTKNDGGTTTWNWTPATNLSCTNCANPTFRSSTTDHVQVIEATSSHNCKVKATVNIAVPYVAPTITNPNPVCQGGAVPNLVAAVTGTGLNWYTTAVGGTSSTTPPTISTQVEGTFDVWVTQTVNNCEGARAKLTYRINPSVVPLPSVSNPTDVCVGGIAPVLTQFVTGNNLTWYSTYAGGLGSNTAPVTSSATAGVFDFWVSQFISECESPRAKISLTVNQITPRPTVSNPADICESESVNLFNSVTRGGPDLRWYVTEVGGTGVSVIIPDNTTPGLKNYWVSQIKNGCESDRTRLSYSVKRKPGMPGIIQPGYSCLNAHAPKLSAFVTGVQLKWYDSPTSNIGRTPEPTTQSNQPGEFNFWVTQTEDGCEGPKAMIGYIIESITTYIDDSFTIEEGESKNLEVQVVTDPANINYQLEWYELPGQLLGNMPIVTVSPVYTTHYKVSATTAHGCSSESNTTVNVINKLYPAAIFSPNGDGLNDFWNVRNIEQFPEATITVFNRWGESVFSTSSYSNNWSGTYQGGLLPVATYYYTIDMSRYGKKTLTGSVSIIK